MRPYLSIDIGLDEGLPLLDHRPQLVCGQIHAVEVSQAVLALKKSIKLDANYVKLRLMIDIGS